MKRKEDSDAEEEHQAFSFAQGNPTLPNYGRTHLTGIRKRVEGGQGNDDHVIKIGYHRHKRSIIDAKKPVEDENRPQQSSGAPRD